MQGEMFVSPCISYLISPKHLIFCTIREFTAFLAVDFAAGFRR